MIVPFASAAILLITDSEHLEQQVEAIIREISCLPVTCVRNIEEARRVLMDIDADLVVIDTPLPGEDAARFATELVRRRAISFGVIVLIGADEMGHDLYQAERVGIITLHKPPDMRLLAQTVRLLLTFQSKIKSLETQAGKLQQKLEDDRLVNRAKLLLIENLKMTEQDAHHYIEHAAMNACVRKTKIAKDILRKYGPK